VANLPAYPDKDEIMQVIDLTHTIHDDIQIYPGDPKPSISRGLTHEKDDCHVDLLNLGSHTGTHIDAPYHFLKDGQRINEIPVQRFIGNGILIDVSGKSDRGLIDSTDLKSSASEINNGDFVILKTGWDRYFGTAKYYLHPYLSADGARLLVKKGVSLVGVDALNVDPTYYANKDSYSAVKDLPDEASYGYPVHDLLLSNNVLIVENLCCLDKINAVKGIYSFLPLKLKDSDGSPIRAVFYGG
jgi:arylformamidase